MIATTPSEIAPNAGAATVEKAMPRAAARSAVRRAASLEIRPDGIGRAGCATRSKSASATSFVAFAVTVRAIAEQIAATIATGSIIKSRGDAPTATPNAAISAFFHRASSRYALTDDTLVEPLVAADDLVLGESRARILRRGGAHRTPTVGVPEHLGRGGGHP